ncbi:MAG: ABC transporter ATP-binding protein [Pseudomonadota bacterium]
MLFEANHLSKSFGALMAVNDISLFVKEGEILAVIGPNGAGKTTLFNLLAGVFMPDAGRIRFLDRDVTGMATNDLCHLGMARSFQITNIFQGLTVQENVRLASQGREKTLRLFGSVAKQRRPIEEAQRIMDLMGLSGHRNTLAGNLSHGEQRYLEIGISLASRPKLLLLDEPTAGMSPAETQVTINLIKQIRKQATIILIEHDMGVVFEVADRLMVMNQGSMLAEGLPTDVKADPRVQAAYFGSEED